MNQTLIIIGVILSLVCNSVGAEQPQQQLTEAINSFSFQLLNTITKEDSATNIVLSPISVHIALSMTLHGATGSTRSAMAKALTVAELSDTELYQAHNTLITTLNKIDPAIELTIANSLWARKDIVFKTPFLERCKTSYNAAIAALDFKTSAAVDTINNWVNKKTNERIPTIIAPPIHPNTLLFLINAVYFQGTWTKTFDPKLTKKRPFTTLNHNEIPVPMMHRSGMYRYLETNKFQAVSLPYGNGRVSMYLFLPQKNTTIHAFLKQLTINNWNLWMLQLRENRGTVILPKFKLEYEKALKNTLQQMGMDQAFSDSAEFDALTDENVYISQVKHKTYIDVNETGTEAAAVTSVEMVTTSVRPPQEPFMLLLDRPFFCVIRDNRTGLVLFAGVIVDPSP